MKLIIGLGNPGKEYDNTRHNIGFMLLNDYVKENWKNKFSADYCEELINNEKIVFIKPQTYMNLSGDSVVKFVEYYKVPLENVLVIHDDMDLEFGSLKFKFDSSSGGHNGIKSIINRLNSQRFCQMKIGINHNKKIDVKDYVLGKFSKEESAILKDNWGNYQNAITSFIINGIEKTMNTYNTK